MRKAIFTLSVFLVLSCIFFMSAQCTNRRMLVNTPAFRRLQDNSNSETTAAEDASAQGGTAAADNTTAAENTTAANATAGNGTAGNTTTGAATGGAAAGGASTGANTTQPSTTATEPSSTSEENKVHRQPFEGNNQNGLRIELVGVVITMCLVAILSI